MNILDPINFFNIIFFLSIKKPLNLDQSKSSDALFLKNCFLQIVVYLTDVTTIWQKHYVILSLMQKYVQLMQAHFYKLRQQNQHMQENGKTSAFKGTFYFTWMAKHSVYSSELERECQLYFLNENREKMPAKNNGDLNKEKKMIAYVTVTKNPNK